MISIFLFNNYFNTDSCIGLTSSFLRNSRLRVNSVNAGVPEGSILGPTLSINDLPNDVVCNIAICADDSTLYSKCDQASDLWQQLELAPELESDLRDTEDWSRKWLVDFNWFHSTGLITLVLLM